MAEWVCKWKIKRKMVNLWSFEEGEGRKWKKWKSIGLCRGGKQQQPLQSTLDDSARALSRSDRKRPFRPAVFSFTVPVHGQSINSHKGNLAPFTVTGSRST